MSSHYKILLANCVCAFLLIAPLNSNAQDPIKITGDFQQLSFEAFAKKIEAATGYHFYFLPGELDSVQVNVHAQQSSIESLLKKIFANSLFKFAIDLSGNIFITKHYQVQVTLPNEYFNKSHLPKDTFAMPPALARKDDNNDHFKFSVENKLFEIGSKTGNPSATKTTLAGYVKDGRTGESIAGAEVSVDSPYTSVLTDQFGYFAITLPTGRKELRIKSFGMKDTRRQVMLNANGRLDIEMEPYVATLQNVVVVAEKNSNTRSLQMGVNKLSIQTIKQVPAILGETDILKVVLTLPGVTTVGEASTGFNVRGGAADQNLILLNDATIYNPSHLFGFFSAFNPDIIKSVELYKSAIPEKYGGRLSSVLDVTTLDGNNKKFSGSGGIGPLTCKLTLEGPIKKDKTSYIIGGRTTYSNWLLHALPNNEYNKSDASFNDINLHLSHTVNTKNNVYLTGYLSSDHFKLNNDTSYKYGNKNLNVKWKHNFSNRFYSVINAGIDHYQYETSSTNNAVNGYRLYFDIRQLNFKTDFIYNASAAHSISFGVNAIHYKLHPGSFEPKGEGSQVTPDIVSPEQGLETAVYLGDKYDINQALSISAGIRLSMFNSLGYTQVNNYKDDVPRTENTIVSTQEFEKGKVVKTYLGPEYRLSIRYSLPGNASLKLSYNTLRQYIHMLSNTTAISPTDIWKLSDTYIRPQQGEQLALGFYKDFKSGSIETSIEVYYKRIKNYMDFKSGATLLLNHHIETDVINTRGKAYGVELFVKKTSGKLNGWISYTYSRTFLQLNDPLAGQNINNGSYYPANFDKPHSVNLIGNYRFTHRYSISLNIVYSTGRPVTLPIALYYLGGAQRVYYSDRNQYRIPDYFRTDLSVNIDGNHKIKKLAHSYWSLGVYNLTARENPYSVYFVQENGVVKGYKLSIFGTAIPFISYNFRF